MNTLTTTPPHEPLRTITPDTPVPSIAHVCRCGAIVIASNPSPTSTLITDQVRFELKRRFDAHVRANPRGQA